MTRRSIVLASAAAIVGALIGILLTPFMATAAVYEPGIVWSDFGTPLERFFGPLVEGAISFGRSDLAYEVYGKAFFLVYLGMVPVIRLVHRVYLSVGGSSRGELWSWRAMYVLLLVALVGDFISYWSLSVPGGTGDAGASLGFLVEINGVGFLLLATAAYATAAMRFNVLPSWAGWLLIAAIPVALLAGIYVVGYFPNAWVVPLSMVWAGVGIWLISGTSDNSAAVWPARIDPVSGPRMTPRAVVRNYWVTGLCLILGVFMLGFGLLLALSPENEGAFSVVYGTLGVASGITILTGVYLLGSHRVEPRKGRLLIGVGSGVAAVFYFWAVIPLALGAVIGWSGIYRNRLSTELRDRT